MVHGITLYIVQGMYTVHCTGYSYAPSISLECRPSIISTLYTVPCTGYGYAPSISLEWRPSIISAYRM